MLFLQCRTACGLTSICFTTYTNLNMNKGKSICNALKKVRKTVADANGIEYNPEPCRHTGECTGTCPACEAEVRYIERELNARRIAGRAVAVAGLALGMVSLSSCGSSGKSVADKTNKLETVPEENRNAGGAEENSRPKLQGMVRYPLNNAAPADGEGGETRAGMPQGGGEDGAKCGADGDEGTHVFGLVGETMPEFPGGQDSLKAYIRRNLRYPDTADKYAGRVVVSIVVDADGSVTDAKIMRGLAPAYDAEALRVVQSMPKWKPGEQSGKKVSVKYVLPVVFGDK